MKDLGYGLSSRLIPLTSSGPGHTGMPVKCTQRRNPAISWERHLSRQSFGTTRRIRQLKPEATWAQPLSREELS